MLLVEDHGPKGRAGEADAATGHRRGLLEEVTGGELSALGQASKLHPSLKRCQMPRMDQKWQENMSDFQSFGEKIWDLFEDVHVCAFLTF